MSQSLGFHRPLIAAVHKGQAPVLVADSIALAASQYAMNAGAANNLQAVRSACLTTEGNKARTPAAGTLAALILGAMDAILRDGPDAGARKGKDDKRTPEQRQVIADAFGVDQRAAFVSAVDGAAAARKEAADKRATEKHAAKGAAPAAGTGEGASQADASTKSAVRGVALSAADALALLAALPDGELMALAAGHSDDARRVSACLTLPLAAGAAAAASVTKKAQRAAKAGKSTPAVPPVDASDVGALGAMAHALGSAGLAPTMHAA